MKSELLQKYLLGEDSLKQGEKDLPLKWHVDGILFVFISVKMISLDISLFYLISIIYHVYDILNSFDLTYFYI